MTRVSTPPTTTSQQPTSQQHSSISHQQIAMRAHELWCKRGRQHGSDRQDWLQAEAELRAEALRNSSSGSMRR